MNNMLKKTQEALQKVSFGIDNDSNQKYLSRSTSVMNVSKNNSFSFILRRRTTRKSSSHSLFDFNNNDDLDLQLSEFPIFLNPISKHSVIVEGFFCFVL